MNFTPHSLIQQDALLSDQKLTVLLTGIQFGKTTVGAIWMKRQMCMFPDPENAFIITAPNYKTMQQSTLPAFLKFMEGMGRYRISDSLFEMHSGAICYFRTATEADSIVGITNVRAIWGDEAGKFSLYFWENMQSRASFKQAPIFLTTTPYTSNWLFKEIVKPYKAGKLPDTTLYSAPSYINPYFPKDEYDKKKMTMDPRRFAALYEGQFEKMQGLVYDCWDEETGVVKPFQLPFGTKYYGGIDWGYTEPFVLSIRAVTPNGFHYCVSEFYKSGMTVNDMILVAKQKKATFDIKTFFAGPDRPENIEEFNRNGLPCIPANNDIRLGVDHQYELIKTGKFKVFDGVAPYLLDELSTYHYPEPQEIDPNKDSKEVNPVGQNDHACFDSTTKVLCEHGEKSISEIDVGDMVYTPLGLRKVLSSGKTGKKELYKATFSNGCELLLTKDHPIFVYKRGFASIDSVRYGVIVVTWKSSRCLMEKSITGMGNIIVLLAVAPKVAIDCIGLFGKNTMEKYQKAITSTIKTVIQKIMRFLILSYYHIKTIYKSIRNIEQKQRLEKCKNTSTTLDTLLPAGTARLKVLSGTENMGLSVWKIEKKKNTNANYAKRYLKQKPYTQDFARTIVSLSLDVYLGLMTFLEGVSFVKNILRLINIQKLDSVELNALVNTNIISDVYNISVENAGCFYANGILVSNCDSNRYCTIMTYKSVNSKTPKVPEEKKEQSLDYTHRLRDLTRKKGQHRGTEKW